MEEDELQEAITQYKEQVRNVIVIDHFSSMLELVNKMYINVLNWVYIWQTVQKVWSVLGVNNIPVHIRFVQKQFIPSF